MSAAVDTDNMRYQRELDRYEARQSLIEMAIEELKSTYWKEYMSTGRIDDLDLDERELTFMACQRGVSNFRDIVESVVRDMVEAKPAEYLGMGWGPV